MVHSTEGAGIMYALFKNILNYLSVHCTTTDRGRLEAAFSKNSIISYRLFHMPVPEFFCAETIRTAAAGLHLGVPVCTPHRCPCGKDVIAPGHYGLSCQLSAGRISQILSPSHSHTCCAVLTI